MTGPTVLLADAARITSEILHLIGGGLGLAPGPYRRSMEEALRNYVWSELHHDVPLVSASLGNDAGIIGAALAGGTNAPSPCPLPEGEGFQTGEAN